MLSTRSTVISNYTSYLLVKKKDQKCSTITWANRRDVSDNSKSEGLKFPLNLSRRLLGQSAIAVFALGFVDAGYSGDWSRIGVITRENEDLLKAAAFLVIPLCILIISSLSRESRD